MILPARSALSPSSWSSSSSASSPPCCHFSIRGVIALFGKLLNDALGDPPWNLVPAARGLLVTSGAGGPMLTREGVLAVYLPLLVILLLLQRRR